VVRWADGVDPDDEERGRTAVADLAEVAAGLYGVPPAEFTAARTAAVRAARADGDRDLARVVGALRKPSTAAAAVNLLARERPDDLGALLDLGVRIREAQAALAGTDLRALHAEQQRAVGAAADAALDLLGGGAGGAVRGQVEATLRAAMGDPDAAAAVATGLLVRDLFSSGFEPVDVEGAVAVPDAPPLAGAPGRRTPLRAVPDDAGRAPAPGGEGDAAASRPGRRRGRLVTEEEPERPLRAAPGGRRGRVRVADEDEPAEPPDAAPDAAPGEVPDAGAGGEPGAGDETVSLPGRRRRGRVRVAGDEPGTERGDGAGGRAARGSGARRDAAPGGAAPTADAAPVGAARTAAPTRARRDRHEADAPDGRARRDAGASVERARREADTRAERERRAEAERERRAEAEREARERRRAAAVAGAEQDLALAREEADGRRGARDAADERLRGAEARADELAGTIARAREEIDRLRAALAAAEQEAREVGLEVRHARSARTAAARQAERADQRLRAAEAALDAL